MIRVLLISVFLFAACARHDPKKGVHFRFDDGSQSPFESTIADQSSALAGADPLLDASEAYRKRDFRLVGVLGIGLSTPGVTVESSKRLLGPQRHLGIKTISGTSDMISSPDHEQMIQRAHEYAKAYNAQMMILLTTGGKAPNSKRSAAP
jgi:hypothetical protein